MELRHLRYFVAVAEEGSLRVAAEKRLHTAQPSLSRQIRDLEYEVGVPLLTRSVHGVELTSGGRAFLDQARLALTQAETAAEAARRAEQPSKPIFAMGFLIGQEVDWLPRATRLLRDELANIEIRISSDHSSTLADELVRGKLDIAFLRAEQLGDIEFKVVAREPLLAILPSDHRLEAIRLARRALELDPRFALAAALAGHCHTLNVLWGYTIDPQFDRKEAIRLSRLALSLDDSDPDTLASASVTLVYMVGDYESAIETSDRAVALNPNSFNAWHYRGWVYTTAGLSEEAVPSFERAMRVSPVDPLLCRSFTGMGMAFIELRRFDEAIVAGKKAQRQNPSYSPAYRCLASAFAHLGRDAEARDAAARLLGVDPAFTISAWIAQGGRSNAKLLIEGMRKAGLPE